MMHHPVETSNKRSAKQRGEKPSHLTNEQRPPSAGEPTTINSNGERESDINYRSQNKSDAKHYDGNFRWEVNVNVLFSKKTA